jgi:hypothetical protein
MRLITAFAFASALVSPVLGLHRRAFLSKRGTRDPGPIASRQYHVPLALVDVCISLDTQAVLVLHPVTDPTSVQGQLCLCSKVSRLESSLTSLH